MGGDNLKGFPKKEVLLKNCVNMLRRRTLKPA